MELRVLYEDNHLIAVYKPAGILVQEDETGDPSLMDQVKYYLKNKYHKLGNVFLGLIHRLDRPVQGVILFAKTSKGASRLSEQFRSRETEKLYHALVIGKPAQPKARLEHYILKDPTVNRVTTYATPHGDAQQALLDYEIVQTNGRYSLLKIKLGTGRPHQIRAQLSAIGCPIMGDVKYGAPEPLPDKSLALCSTSLTFKTATTNETVHVSVDVPESWRVYLV